MARFMVQSLQGWSTVACESHLRVTGSCLGRCEVPSRNQVCGFRRLLRSATPALLQILHHCTDVPSEHAPQADISKPEHPASQHILHTLHPPLAQTNPDRAPGRLLIMAVLRCISVSRCRQKGVVPNNIPPLCRTSKKAFCSTSGTSACAAPAEASPGARCAGAYAAGPPPALGASGWRPACAPASAPASSPAPGPPSAPPLPVQPAPSPLISLRTLEQAVLITYDTDRLLALKSREIRHPGKDKPTTRNLLQLE